MEVRSAFAARPVCTVTRSFWLHLTAAATPPTNNSRTKTANTIFHLRFTWYSPGSYNKDGFFWAKFPLRPCLHRLDGQNGKTCLKKCKPEGFSGVRSLGGAPAWKFAIPPSRSLSCCCPNFHGPGQAQKYYATCASSIFLRSGFGSAPTL